MCVREGKETMVILLSVKEVLKATGLSSRPYVWRRIKEGRFPAPVRISGDRKHQYFRQEEITAWTAEQAARKRDTAKRARSRTGKGPDGDTGGSSARLTLVEARVDALENPESGHARSLAALADKIDSETPGKVPGFEVDKMEARARLTAVE